MKTVEDLDVFKLSHQLALQIYEVTKNFPEYEKFGLISQMRRSAYSIPMNLLEGSHRLSTKEYRQFVGIARGSAGEMKSQLLLARDLKYVSNERYRDLIERYER
jgi:four helix bundle protein